MLFKSLWYASARHVARFLGRCTSGYVGGCGPGLKLGCSYAVSYDVDLTQQYDSHVA